MGKCSFSAKKLYQQRCCVSFVQRPVSHPFMTCEPVSAMPLLRLQVQT